jgi:hypothetical protein
VIEQKAALLAVYGVLLVVACILPFALQLRAYKYPSAWTIDRVYGAALAVAGLALLAVRPWPGLTSPLVLSIAFAAPLLFSGAGYAIGGLLALPLVAAATWWDPSLRLDATRAGIFLIVGVLAVALPRLLPRTEGAPPLPSLLVVLLLGVAAVSFTGVMGSPQGFGTVWHHWSVYVGSSQALLGGAIPFQDYPVQYGMGPTLLVAALCGQECWSGAYIAAAATNLLYLLAMAGSVVLLTRRLPMGLALVPLAAMACAILMWTGYPPDFKGPIATPSVDGLRFFPLAALLCFIIAVEERGFRLDAVGHALWLLGVVWSPEAAFYATVVWWPYLALRRAQDIGAASVTGVTIEVLRGAGVAVVATAAAFAALATLFWVVYHQWPSIDGFTAYVRDPPGILPVNPTGPIWLALAAAGVVAVAQLRADARGIRLGFVALMGLLAAGSYYLGRSHDNNVLNLLPFVVLALTTALAIGLKDVASGFAQVTLASLVALLATFGFESWNAAAQRGEAWEIGPSHFINNIRLAAAESSALLDQSLADPPKTPAPAPAADAAAAQEWLRARGEGAPVWVSPSMLLPYGPPVPAWTAMNDVGAFALLPHDEVETFIRNGAQHLHRPGWILVDRTQTTPWPALFFASYSVTEQRDFGGYTAYRLAPK